jgi:hypothetical protein
MQVLVCDDQKHRADEVKKQIVESGCGHDVVVLAGPDLTNALHALNTRVQSALMSPDDYSAQATIAFDESDVVIVDNNLAHLEIKGARLTAEAVVGLVRVFSDAGYIVSLNKNPDVDFDLRYLLGDHDTRADLALNAAHLAIPQLWTGDVDHADVKFKPWYWPALSHVAERRRKQIAFVEERFEMPVLQALGFPSDPATLDHLSLHARGALVPEARLRHEAPESAVGEVPGAEQGSAASVKVLEEVTFLDVFLASGRALPDKFEREEMAKSTNPTVRRCIARAVAAEVDRWIRRDVLGPQGMLVDVPHLLMRAPFLLRESIVDQRAWSATITNSANPFSSLESETVARLQLARFAHDEWVPSPAFWWPAISREEWFSTLISEGVAQQPTWPDLVFCEDTCAFFSRDAVQEFATEYGGAWGRRYVQYLRDWRYAPASNFAR